MTTPTILLVDDTPAVREVVRDMLEEIGFSDIHEASNGAEALEVMRTHTIALVVSDFNMAPKTGLDLLQAMKIESGYAAIPFIMITSESDQTIATRAQQLGANAFLKKPLAYPNFKREVVAMVSPS